MIQIDVINGLAQGVVGWKQPTRTGAPVVTAGNIASSSGLQYHLGHALCTVENIKASIEDESISDINLNAVLLEFAQAGLIDVCTKLFTDEDHVDTGLFYKYENKVTETIENGTDFVGFEIDLAKRNDLSIILNSLILEFNGVETIKLILLNSTQNALIKSQSITTLANSAKEQSVNWCINDLQYGGKWYLGYLRSALTAKAIKRNFQMASFATMFPDVGIRPIRVPLHNTETMFDPSLIRYEADTWGMNFNMSMYKDYTNIVKSNLSRFAKAMQLQTCVNVITMISNSIRSGRSERLSKAYALLELDGNRSNPALPYHIGLNAILDKEIKRLRETYTPKGIIRVTI